MSKDAEEAKFCRTFPSPDEVSWSLGTVLVAMVCHHKHNFGDVSKQGRSSRACAALHVC